MSVLLNDRTPFGNLQHTELNNSSNGTCRKEEQDGEDCGAVAAVSVSAGWCRATFVDKRRHITSMDLQGTQKCKMLA